MPETIGPEVAIVVLNWNGSEDTAACLRSLRHSDAAAARIAVFDNGSRPEELRRLQELEGFELLRSEENLGFAEGNNEAVRRLGEGARTLVLLNNDTEVPPVWLGPLLSTLEEKEPCIASPAILRGEPGAPREWWFTGSHIAWWLGRPVLETEEPSPRVRELPYVPGCCLAIRRSDWERLGGFDPSYFAYFEDTGLCLEARAAGIRCFVDPRGPIHHKVSRATGEEHPFRIELFARNRIRFMRRFGPWWSWPTFAAIQVAGRFLFSLKYFRSPGGWKRYAAFARGTARGFLERAGR